jgi:Peptidase propeptide and YPEB domain
LLDKIPRKPLDRWMKQISFLALGLFLCLSFLSASPLDSKSGTKITKNEAEHIALQRCPGRVTAAKLETMRGKKVWLLDIAQPKSKEITQVAVDAVTGRIASGKESGR